MSRLVDTGCDVIARRKFMVVGDRSIDARIMRAVHSAVSRQQDLHLLSGGIPSKFCRPGGTIPKQKDECVTFLSRWPIAQAKVSHEVPSKTLPRRLNYHPRQLYPNGGAPLQAIDHPKQHTDRHHGTPWHTVGAKKRKHPGACNVRRLRRNRSEMTSTKIACTDCAAISPFVNENTRRTDSIHTRKSEVDEQTPGCHQLRNSCSSLMTDVALGHPPEHDRRTGSPEVVKRRRPQCDMCLLPAPYYAILGDCRPWPLCEQCICETSYGQGGRRIKHIYPRCSSA